MKRTLFVLLTASLAVGVVAAPAGGSPDGAAAAAKCKKGPKGKKCRAKQKRAAPAGLKDGTYTYVEPRTKIKESVVISGKGTKITLSYNNFWLADDCVQTKIPYGTFPLKKSKSIPDTVVFQSSPTNAYTIKVAPISPQGLGGGLAETDGEINVKTLRFTFSFNVRMKNENAASSCFEFPDADGVLKKSA